MLYWLGVLLATIGATLILSALAFVSALVGVLVNAMIVIVSGPLIDRLLPAQAEPSQPVRRADFHARRFGPAPEHGARPVFPGPRPRGRPTPARPSSPSASPPRS